MGSKTTNSNATSGFTAIREDCQSYAASLLDLRAETDVDFYNLDLDCDVKRLTQIKKTARQAGMAYTVLDRFIANIDFAAKHTYIVACGEEKTIRSGFDEDGTVPNEIVEQWQPKNNIPQKCNGCHTMV